MLTEIRGGVPVNQRAAVTSTPAGHAMGVSTPEGYQPGGVTKYLALQNESAVAVRVAWSEAEMTAGDYFTLYANNDPSGRDRWQGPVELADGRDKVWLATAAGSADVCITFFQRRG